MNEIDLFAHAIGVQEPWSVKEVRVDIEKRRVEVEVQCAQTLLGGPSNSAARSHPRLREAKLAPSGYHAVRDDHHGAGATAEISRRPYGVACDSVGRCAHQAHPFFEAWAIKVLSACANLTDACRLLRLKWNTANRIMQRAAERGLARRKIEDLRRVGLDEKSIGRGQDCISLMTDLDSISRHKPLQSVPGRRLAIASS
jgi:hypothetical protein